MSRSSQSQQPHSQQRDHAWIVIVRDDVVLKRYRSEQPPADISKTMPAALCGDDVDVWSVDPRMPEPPAEGQQVDPLQPGWTCISDRECKSDHQQP